MSEITLHTGCQGDWDVLHIAWHDENNVLQETRLDVRIQPQDKPRTLAILVNGVVVATVPRAGG